MLGAGRDPKGLDQAVLGIRKDLKRQTVPLPESPVDRGRVRGNPYQLRAQP
jgi:hypothetical protein